MNLWNLPTIVLIVTFGYSTFATPLAIPQLLSRNHVECSSSNSICQVQQTCDNAPSIVAGTVPEPWPSSVTIFDNPVPGVELLSKRGSGASNGPKQLSRQTTTARWCALGTQLYILLALQGTKSAAAVKNSLGTAVQQVESQMAAQTANISQTAIANGSAPVYSLAETDSKITANNAAGASMTWLELELGLLMMEDWMDKNSYGFGSASVWNGTDEVGIIYITV